MLTRFDFLSHLGLCTRSTDGEVLDAAGRRHRRAATNVQVGIGVEPEEADMEIVASHASLPRSRWLAAEAASARSIHDIDTTHPRSCARCGGADIHSALAGTGRTTGNRRMASLYRGLFL